MDNIYKSLTAVEAPSVNMAILEYLNLFGFAQCGTVEARFIPVAVNMYKKCDNKQLANAIFLYLTCMYDSELQLELLDHGFVQDCIPKYIYTAMHHLETRMHDIYEGVLMADSQLHRVFDFIELYMDTCAVDDANTYVYTWIYTLLINLSYKDIIRASIVQRSIGMYMPHTTPAIVQRDIANFLFNVYFDEIGRDYIDRQVFMEIMSHFVLEYTTRSPAFSAQVFREFSCELIGANTKMVDMYIELLCAHAVGNSEIFDNLCAVLKDNSEDAEFYDAVIASSRVRRTVDAIVHSEDENAITRLVDMFSIMTSSNETEKPCQFICQHIFKPIFKKESERPYVTRTSRLLFALGNVFANAANWRFVDIDCVIEYISNVMNTFPKQILRNGDIFYVIRNMSASPEFMKALVRTHKFMHMFTDWLMLMTQSSPIELHHNCKYVHKIIFFVFSAIARDETVWHYFDARLGDVVRNIASRSIYVRKAVVDNIMNSCTLQQKCALVLYRENKITRQELYDLDVTVYT